MTDEEFLTAFEKCTLPFEQWNHRAHVRVAYLYASGHDLEAATERMRSGVKAYNKANQVPESLNQGYHETITSAFMQLIGEAVSGAGQPNSFADFEHQWSQLFDKRVLRRFYSRTRILSAEAKARLVEPNIAPLSLAVLESQPSQLVVFDIDGTLVQSIGVDDRCFTQAVTDVLGVESISTDWAGYQYQTDAGIVFEIASKHFGSSPTDGLTKQVRDRFMRLLDQVANQADFSLLEVPGAGELLNTLRYHSTWCVSIATGGWVEPAKLKLRLAGVEVDDLPFATSDDAVAREDIIKCSIERAKQHYGISRFTKVVYVGDGSWDVAAARNLQIGFVGVTTDQTSKAFADDDVPVVADFLQPLSFLRILTSATSAALD